MSSAKASVVRTGAGIESDPLPGRQSAPKSHLDKKTIPYLLLLPAFLYYVVFWLAPVLSGMAEVFTDSSGHFTLIENFRLMFESELFGGAVMNTAVFAAVSVVIQFVLAMLLAILLNRKFRGSKLYMFISMVPMAITPTAVAILWKTGLVKDGWINSLLIRLHFINSPVVFMNAEGMAAVFLVILIDTWTVTPSVMIILLAGLQGMRKELKEAAYLFGANKWQIFKDVVFPILKPSVITSVILRLIAAIQVWAISVMVLGYSKVPFLVERIAFYVDEVPGLPTSQKLAFTLSFTTTVIVFLVTIIYLKVSNRKTPSEVK